MCLCRTFLFSTVYCSDSDIFHSHWSPRPLLHLRASSKISCAALFSPLHFHGLVSLSFPLSPYHLASHLWQDTGERLPGPDLYLCNALSSPTTSFPPLLSSPHDSLPPSICALVCALRLFVHIRTETHPDSYLCRIHNTRRPANDIHSQSFFLSMSLWCKSKCTYIVYSLWFQPLVPTGKRK